MISEIQFLVGWSIAFGPVAKEYIMVLWRKLPTSWWPGNRKTRRGWGPNTTFKGTPPVT
jgi:hypothetical protein